MKNVRPQKNKAASWRLLVPLLLAMSPAFAASSYTVGQVNLPKDWTGATQFPFSSAQGLATDSSGNVYVASTSENRIYKVTKSGSSWSATVIAGSGAAGNADGTGTAASFNHPTGVAVDAAGNIIVADSGNGAIRKISSTGDVSTIAGQSTRLGTLGGIAVDSAGNVYATDTSNHAVWKVSSTGTLTALSYFDGTGNNIALSSPIGIAVDANQNVFVAEKVGRIRWITPDGFGRILAGSNVRGYSDGPGSTARFWFLDGVANMAIASDGNLLVTDNGNCTIRQIDMNGVTRTVAGKVDTSTAIAKPMCAYADGTGSAARLYYPLGIAVDALTGVGYINEGNTGLRSITPNP